MPYYNQLYQSELLNIQPLVSVDRSVEHKGEGSDTHSILREGSNKSESTATGNTDTWSYYSDTPQGGIVGIQNNEYLTNATHNTGGDGSNSSLIDESRGSETGSGKRCDSYVDKISGFEGNQSDMLLKFRKTFLNIDMLIIDELKDLFFTIW